MLNICDPCSVGMHDRCITHVNDLVVCICEAEVHRSFHLVDKPNTVYRTKEGTGSSGGVAEVDYDLEPFRVIPPGSKGAVHSRPPGDEEDAFEVERRYLLRHDGEHPNPF